MNRIQLEVLTNNKKEFELLKQELKKETFEDSGINKVTIINEETKETFEILDRIKEKQEFTERYILLHSRLNDLVSDKIHKQKMIFGQYTNHTLEYIYKRHSNYVKDLMNPENKYAEHMERTSNYNMQAVYFRTLIEIDEIEEKIKTL